jgi:protein TonB
LVIFRWFLSLVLAASVTLSLFFLMHKLIELGKMDLGDKDQVRVIDFIRLKRDSRTETKKRALPKKRKMDTPPKAPSMNMPKSTTGAGMQAIRISAPTPNVSKRVRMVGGPSMGSAPSDGGEIPLVRIQPMYPRQAAERRIEGWVVLKFTISTSGSVKRARVLRSEPPRIFNKVALKAIKKWKYKPKVKNGVPVETPGVTVRLTFKLDN